MRNVLSVLAVAAAAALFGAAFAHEGHDHSTVMGTVKSLDAKASLIEVETVDHKTVACTVNAATKFLRGDKAAAFADVKVGDRVVVTLNGAVTPAVAMEVKLAPAAATPPSRQPDHDHSSPHRR